QSFKDDRAFIVVEAIADHDRVGRQLHFDRAVMAASGHGMSGGGTNHRDTETQRKEKAEKRERLTRHGTSSYFSLFYLLCVSVPLWLVRLRLAVAQGH